MTNHIQPKLTIGIIFKNEIRCLERCLKSLTPLREHISCELIMADTGSCDGSREVAANYADILFDFPWIDDFSAARNAVMDKASGEWYLTIDADEFFDSDISELLTFFHDRTAQKNAACSLVQRNYESVDLTGDYSDFMAIRMLRMSLDLRYEGAIHETWYFPEGSGYAVYPLSRTVLHHDGYAGLNEERGRLKRERNLALIKKQLKKDPENLMRLLQYIESGAEENNLIDVIKKAALLVENKKDGWKHFGPPIFRYAVREARERNLPELYEWVERAWKWFPDSFFTRIDVEYITFANKWDKKEHADCIFHGERYLKAVADYRKGRGDHSEFMYGSLLCGSPSCEQTALLYLADTYVKIKDYQHAVQMLEKSDCAVFDVKQTENFIRILWKIHTGSLVDTAPALMQCFEKIQSSAFGKKQADDRIKAFYRASVNLFSVQDKEESGFQDFLRSSHTLFLPFNKGNELGCAAMIMETKDLLLMQELLNRIENWERFPIEALAYALQSGVSFPLSGSPLKLEAADSLAVRLAVDKDSFFNILFKPTEEEYSSDLQKLIWMRGLVLIAVRIFEWEVKSSDITGNLSAGNITKGVNLAHLFAKVEKEFLPHYYSPDILQEENILTLPLLHRFGWYCAQAFISLEQGDPVGYVHKLRAGLNACPEMNAMVEYLLKHTPQLQNKQEDVSPELQLLAEQVRTLLSSYPPNDPAVAAIKASPAYQKVAGIIENSEPKKGLH